MARTCALLLSWPTGSLVAATSCVAQIAEKNQLGAQNGLRFGLRVAAWLENVVLDLEGLIESFARSASA